MEQTCNNAQQVGEQVGTGILSGDESGTGQVIAASTRLCMQAEELCRIMKEWM